MAKQMQKQHREIMQKQQVLDRVKATLKQEYIGIDPVIEEVVDALSSWYMFPDLQEKPLVINLWGMTGVGKSSLVTRLAQLLGFEQRYYHFDLGENDEGDWNIKRKLAEIYENMNGYPVLLALDEFQHARTLDEIGREVNKTASRIIWQLMDSGRFQVSRFSFQVDEIYDLVQKLRYLLRNGVRVSGGKVVSKQAYYMEHMESKKEADVFDDLDLETDSSLVFFVPESCHEGIYSMAKERFNNRFEVKEKLETLDGYQTIQFLMEIITLGNSPRQVDCSKALVFVLGNLDEAYTMSNDYNPDMDADEFHEQSLKIHVPAVKKALKERFRNEQIARLGNLHIIFPAFSRHSFQRIIGLELSRIAEKVARHQQIKLEFDPSLHELVYKEGVYPTQGTRPIFTTIHQLVSTKLGRVLAEMIMHKLNASQITFRVEGNSIMADYYREGVIIHSLAIPQALNLEKLRKNKQDDVQAITAVHESGHAIVSMLLLHTVPDLIFSNSTEGGTGGFVFTKFKWKYISRKEITRRLALYLGGLAAEKIVFGEENLTTGASEDIEKATLFVGEMLNQCGMGRLPVAYHVKDANTRNFLHDESGDMGREVAGWMEKGMALAEKTLKAQELLLLKMADYLSDHRQMTRQQATEMLMRYAHGFDPESLIEDGSLLFYRRHLKQKVQAIGQSGQAADYAGSCTLALNNKTDRSP